MTPTSIFASADAELLITTWPLLRLLRGDKRAHMRTAWIGCALRLSSKALAMHEDRLPQSPRAAALMLHEACMELAEGLGIGRAELAEHFNARGEAGDRGDPAEIDAGIERVFALISVLAAERWKASAE